MRPETTGSVTMARRLRQNVENQQTQSMLAKT